MNTMLTVSAVFHLYLFTFATVESLISHIAFEPMPTKAALKGVADCTLCEKLKNLVVVYCGAHGQNDY